MIQAHKYHLTVETDEAGKPTREESLRTLVAGDKGLPAMDESTPTCNFIAQW